MEGEQKRLRQNGQSSLKGGGRGGQHPLQSAGLRRGWGVRSHPEQVYRQQPHSGTHDGPTPPSPAQSSAESSAGPSSPRRDSGHSAPYAITVANGRVRVGSKVQTTEGGPGVVARILTQDYVEVAHDSGRVAVTRASEVQRQTPHVGASYSMSRSDPSPYTTAVTNGWVRCGSKVVTDQGPGVVVGLPSGGLIEVVLEAGQKVLLQAKDVRRQVPHGKAAVEEGGTGAEEREECPLCQVWSRVLEKGTQSPNGFLTVCAA